jgi:exodeoxyribonuclease V alpha subunit
MPDLSSPGTDSDFYFVPTDDPALAVSRIIELAKTRIANVRCSQYLRPCSAGRN